jgi:hypothetical protein
MELYQGAEASSFGYMIINIYSSPTIWVIDGYGMKINLC